MDRFELYDGEYRFMCVIWENEPIKSTNLHKICLERLGWKKSTTYTMIRKLSNKGLIENKETIVASIVKQDEIKKMESEKILDRVFNNSLPHFMSAFLKNKTISKEEAIKLKALIEEATEVDE